MKKKKSKVQQKDFCWHGTRWGFWTATVLFVVSIILAISIAMNPTLSMTLALTSSLWALSISLFFVMIVSIIHLNKHKQKGFAITALILSSLLLILILLPLVILHTIAVAFDSMGPDLECSTSCTEVGAVDYAIDSSDMCTCFDAESNIVLQTQMTFDS